MNLDGAQVLARRGELYPGVILHGATAEQRLEAGVMLAQTLLCEMGPDDRPCGDCRHCRRVVSPAQGEGFHPDFRILERDLKTSTSVEATKAMLRMAQVTPFEARGQVFLLASAETLTGAAANALLKNLEEPATSAPRHFLLLAPSSLDLLPTLRSRSLAIYLGAAAETDPEAIADLAGCVVESLLRYEAGRSSVDLVDVARQLERAGDWQDLRAVAPWITASSAMLQVARTERLPSSLVQPSLALAESLLAAPAYRLRRVQVPRILQGLVVKHLRLRSASRRVLA